MLESTGAGGVMSTGAGGVLSTGIVSVDDGGSVDAGVDVGCEACEVLVSVEGLLVSDGEVGVVDWVRLFAGFAGVAGCGAGVVDGVELSDEKAGGTGWVPPAPPGRVPATSVFRQHFSP
jgi:hypothetical protein